MNPGVVSVVFRAVFCILSLALFLVGASFNLRCLWLGFIRRVRTRSLIPFVAGVGVGLRTGISRRTRRRLVLAAGHRPTGPDQR